MNESGKKSVSGYSKLALSAVFLPIVFWVLFIFGLGELESLISNTSFVVATYIGFVLSWISGVAAVVLGTYALRRIKKSQGTLKGSFLAKTGRVFGVITVLIALQLTFDIAFTIRRKHKVSPVKNSQENVENVRQDVREHEKQ